MTIEVVAHRGASAERPEHTRAAYELAVAQGADGLECDVRLTRDGHLVCVHDRTVNRTSNATGVVSSYTLDELRRLDFSGWYNGSRAAPAASNHGAPNVNTAPIDTAPIDTDAGGSARAGGGSTAGDGVLSLRDLLDLVCAAPRPLRLFVETKHPVRYAGLVEDRLLDELARHGLDRPRDKESSPIVVMSFATTAVRRIRAARPALPTVQLFARPPARYRDGSLPEWADLAGPSVAALRADPDYVARLAEHGHDTYCWTADDPADVLLCGRLGVRYVATNRPADTRRILGTD